MINEHIHVNADPFNDIDYFFQLLSGPQIFNIRELNWPQCIKMKYGVRHQTPLMKEEDKKADACLFK
uniref:Uncharacterized protein n=1 Tax=Romanomermis culicivorax TaxID=13658 RepID=A0A915LA54_ROMCU